MNPSIRTVSQLSSSYDHITKAKSQREPFTNITNSKKEGTKNAKREERSDDHLLPKNKKKKSDPMVIDEEDVEADVYATTSTAPNTITITYEDIDLIDVDDPQAVSNYVNDIYAYLMEKEKDCVNPSYMSKQVAVNEKMRSTLVDWLVEVHRMFKLIPETLFLSVAIVDRYLSMTIVSREQIQLIGITSMLIASKYEEIYAPECNDFVYICDGAYTKSEILKTEQTILNTLNFNITHPSSLHFLRRYSKAARSDYTVHTLCKFLIELALLDINFLKYPTSLVAAAAVYLARAMIQSYPLWNSTLEHYSTYREERVRSCAIEMNSLLKKCPKMSLKAIYKKYSSPKFGQVAEMPTVDL